MDDKEPGDNEASLAPNALHLSGEDRTVGVAHTTCCVGREATRGAYRQIIDSLVLHIEANRRTDD